MLSSELFGPLAGAILLGAVHGVEPGHGWPVAASYALDQTNKWLYGFAASTIIGLGHLVSSLAMVAAFFYAKSYFDLTRVNEPVTVPGGVQIGGPVSLVAGVLLIGLGVREYFHGHSHGAPGEANDHGHDHGHPHEGDDQHGHGHPHEGDDQHGHGHPHEGDDQHGHGHPHEGDDQHEHDHSHDGAGDGGGRLARIKGVLPFVGGHSHSHDGFDESADRGLLGIAWFAFVLGFAHEEEFEIIALCAGSNYCLELMSAYALTVIAGIVGLTMLLIAGYHRSRERVERYTPYLPAFSAAVLIVMGVGFIAGVF